MNPIKLDVGGELRTGDVIGVSYSNWISYGWYVESGKYGSLKFIGIKQPAYTKQAYESFKNGANVNDYTRRKYEKGLVFKNIGKDFIVSYGGNRAFKIPNPEEFFKDSTLEEEYKESKEVLQQLNFPAK